MTALNYHDVSRLLGVFCAEQHDRTIPTQIAAMSVAAALDKWDPTARMFTLVTDSLDRLICEACDRALPPEAGIAQPPVCWDCRQDPHGWTGLDL